jgi:hypothetical protein
MSPWWSGLVGVVVGWLLSEVVRRRDRSTRRGAQWGALRAEMHLCRGLADTYRRDPYKAPSYRLPTTAYRAAFAALLGDGAVAEDEARVLTEFFSEVETINRGLDYTQAARERNDEKALDEEVNRNHIKAGNLIDKHYQRAIEVVNRHLPKFLK